MNARQKRVLKIQRRTLVASEVKTVAATNDRWAALPEFVTQGGVAGWLQGLGTVAAVLVAICALSQWRQQETANRKSEAATEIIKMVSALSGLVGEAQTYKWLDAPIYEPNDAVLRAVVEESKRARLEERATILEDLDIKNDLLQGLHPNPDIFRSVLCVMRGVREFREAIQTLERLNSGNHEPMEKSLWREKVKKNLEIVGVWEWKDAEIVINYKRGSLMGKCNSVETDEGTVTTQYWDRLQRIAAYQE